MRKVQRAKSEKCNLKEVCGIFKRIEISIHIKDEVGSK